MDTTTNKTRRIEYRVTVYFDGELWDCIAASTPERAFRIACAMYREAPGASFTGGTAEVLS